MFNRFFIAYLLIITISACNVLDRHNDKDVITVGNTGITKDVVRKDIRRIISEMGMTEDEAELAIRFIVGKVTEKYLIMEYGKEEGITLQDDELKAALSEIKKDYPEDVFNEMLLERYIDYDTWEEELRQDLLIRKIITNVFEGIPHVSFNETMAYYESHKNEFMRPQMVQLRQIVTSSREDAEKILDRIAKGEEMEKLAKEYSITSDVKDGGLLGWIPKGRLEEDMEAIIFSLPINTVSPILKSPYGYHIFEVLSVRDEGLKTLPEAKADIESVLTLQKRELFYGKWIEGLKDHFPVNINEEVYSDWKITEG
ncbi:MAG TPA: peptidyl-prolyl cis-trans isomerase [Desulfatiglandales bacterium]|nr:peptidyl-prolyl cis-trans isomerase [Desulfatiglandales bacterium]